MSYKLFIPGPIAVSEKTLRAMAQPMIGHRSTDFVALYQSIQPGLQALLAPRARRARPAPRASKGRSVRWAPRGLRVFPARREPRV